jgi:hypothetical protein
MGAEGLEVEEAIEHEVGSVGGWVPLMGRPRAASADAPRGEKAAEEGAGVASVFWAMG